MPTQKDKKQRQTLLSRIHMSRKVFWLLFVLLLLVGAALVTPIILQYQKDQAIAADRARFEQADKDIADIRLSLIKNTNPFLSNQLRQCDKASGKIEFKPITCMVTAQFSYGVSTLEEADTIIASVVAHIKNEGSSFRVQENILEDLSTENTYSQDLAIKYNADNLACNLSFEFFDSQHLPSYYSSIKTNKAGSLIALFSCKGEARHLHF